jgi:hypothetical protein
VWGVETPQHAEAQAALSTAAKAAQAARPANQVKNSLLNQVEMLEGDFKKLKETKSKVDDSIASLTTQLESARSASANLASRSQAIAAKIAECQKKIDAYCEQERVAEKAAGIPKATAAIEEVTALARQYASNPEVALAMETALGQLMKHVAGIGAKDATSSGTVAPTTEDATSKPAQEVDLSPEEEEDLPNFDLSPVKDEGAVAEAVVDAGAGAVEEQQGQAVADAHMAEKAAAAEDAAKRKAADGEVGEGGESSSAKRGCVATSSPP